MKSILSLMFIIAVSNSQADSLDAIYKQVINDSIAKYEIVKRQGDPIEICVNAGLVSASYLQAKDEKNYNLWKIKEKEDCKKAGL